MRRVSEEDWVFVRARNWQDPQLCAGGTVFRASAHTGTPTAENQAEWSSSGKRRLGSSVLK